MCAILIEHLTYAHATLTSLCASQIALAVARCSVWDRTQPIIAAFLSLWNFVSVRSLWLWRCSFLRSRASPSHNIVRVRSLSLWRGAQYEMARSLSQPSRHFVRVRSLWLCRGAQLRSHAANYRSLLVSSLPFPPQNGQGWPPIKLPFCGKWVLRMRSQIPLCSN